ncbi:Pleiotropic drug resistance transporter [Melia azedarach]|uniref:Pleiotropic drug resistance transporter n=1 Tax=Melia azedarach TaxID=155640 RepID=A0ACC1YDN2_MELAZ|nr:Pleiotropic drug resistance transporter [Melia azedarach]
MLVGLTKALFMDDITNGLESLQQLLHIIDAAALISLLRQHQKPLNSLMTSCASGVGKTTLLDVLAGRKSSGLIGGEIQIGGYPKVEETFATDSGYCEQNVSLLNYHKRICHFVCLPPSGS